MFTKTIAFFDVEISGKTKISDIGAVWSDKDGSFHGTSVGSFENFIANADFLCGHNILHHDVPFLKENGLNLSNKKFIDTLYWSPLLFPKNPYHRLVKDDKLDPEGRNNPLNDSIKAKDLFYSEVHAFQNLPEHLKNIYFRLLYQQKEFSGLFLYLNFISDLKENITGLIKNYFKGTICENADLASLIGEHPVSLAYALAIINCHDKYSITPKWILKNYPEIENILYLLRNKPCHSCHYCEEAFDPFKGLSRFFGFSGFRAYDGEPLQQKAVEAALDNKSLLAIFPTGGGKSITFQLPALIAAENTKGLTVVISPLQSLMKDQVDNLREKGISDVATINGLLDPIERSHYYELVESGKASLLYISPESLRSASITRLLLSRTIERFVIDEAHCFSAWGQDFRVDYLYIGEFLKQLQEKKELVNKIPVSCFSATAKQKVIEDIRSYFKEKLNLDLEVFASRSSRANLHYKVFNKPTEEEKYTKLRNLLEQKDCPTIIYVSRTRRVQALTETLRKDGINATGYHGKMDAEVKMKNQEAFMKGEVNVMVATSAFGMGVDKSDVGMVVHYEISDSLENYVQEAGRAGRNENISADCYVLFSDEDLNKHFVLLNQTKITQNEIQQIWRAIKNLSKTRESLSNSALEIARKAGWDDNISEIETRVTSAIAALEDAGYVKRGQNSPRVFANSILSKNAQEAIDIINASVRFRDDKKKEKAVRIIKRLFSSKSRKSTPEDPAETRIDYLSDTLGVVKEEIIEIVNLLKEENILADFKDLSTRIKVSETGNRSLKIFDSFRQIETLMLQHIEEEERDYSVKVLNEAVQSEGSLDCNPQKLKTVLNLWSVTGLIKRRYSARSKDHVTIAPCLTTEELKAKTLLKHQLAKFLTEYLFQKVDLGKDVKKDKDELLVDFSVVELKHAYENQGGLFKAECSLKDVEDTLFYLSRIEAIKIDGGFFVLYNKLNISRVELDSKIQYKKEDYRKLEEFYKNRVQQVHIVGEYAKKMIGNYKEALQFADDYFNLNYSSFLRKYFPGSRANEINRTLTKDKFQKLFGTLSPDQLKIINDNVSQNIVVAAGPGSGKTRILVHKLASILYMEDIKHEQLLMLTFSRAAATEFKLRLKELIGNAANFVKIKTFHSFCFDVLGKVGNLDLAGNIIRKAVESIRSGEAEQSQVTKAMLVVDEAQDMTSDEFELVKALAEQNEGMRIILVGDDDQNIYEFRGASSDNMQQLLKFEKSVKYDLVENYRSRKAIIDFSNQWISQIPHRLKSYPVQAVNKDEPGRVKVIKHKSNVILPLVNELLTTDLTGSTCVLTQTNEESSLVFGLLKKQGIPARLIQSNEGFNLYHLQELRYFTELLQKKSDVPVVDESYWRFSLEQLKTRYQRSSKLNECINLIRQFEAVHNQKKYFNDWKMYLQESNLEDFIRIENELIYISTIHKAKGKEFDTVYMLLNQQNIKKYEDVRRLYVGFTRAKKELVAHYKGDFLYYSNLSGIEYGSDPREYPLPEELAMDLSHKDVVLGYFSYIQRRVEVLQAGDELQISGHELHHKGSVVVKFSKAFNEKLERWQLKGYCLTKAEVNFIVHWKDKEVKDECKVVLPKVVLSRG
ncbi:MAG: RecQ family ATP-dependent DNA helicase [Cytophagaceae bacterium]